MRVCTFEIAVSTKRHDDVKSTLRTVLIHSSIHQFIDSLKCLPKRYAIGLGSGLQKPNTRSGELTPLERQFLFSRGLEGSPFLLPFPFAVRRATAQLHGPVARPLLKITRQLEL